MNYQNNVLNFFLLNIQIREVACVCILKQLLLMLIFIIFKDFLRILDRKESQLRPIFLKMIVCGCYLQLILASICFFVTVGKYENVNMAGDVIIGAMFAVHNMAEGDSCGLGINDQSGFQRLEAFLFALDKVNNEVLNKKGGTLLLHE